MEGEFIGDMGFVATGTGATVTDVPEGFCSVDVYNALFNAENALEVLNGEAAYAEWLAAREIADRDGTIAALDGEEESIRIDEVTLTQEVSDYLTELINNDVNDIFESVEDLEAYLLPIFASDDTSGIEDYYETIVPDVYPEGLLDEAELLTSYQDFYTAIGDANYINAFNQWIRTDEDAALPTECLDGDECCAWRMTINGIVTGSEADAVMIQNILGGADNEANRQAFLDSGYVAQSFGAPPAPAGGCFDEAAYIDAFDHATQEVQFLSGFEAWCSEDPLNCPSP